MDTMDKHVALIGALSKRTTLLQLAERVNIESKRPPHFRTFVSVGKDLTKEATREIEDIAEEHALTANVFRVGGRVNAVTFVDLDELARD